MVVINWRLILWSCSHVSPSFQFGYAPSCYTHARVIPVGDGGSAAGLETSPPEGTGAFSQRNRDYDLVTKEGIVEALQVCVRLGCYHAEYRHQEG